MESINKYTIITAIIILTFLICIGAIYSNTNELKERKGNLDKTKIEIKNKQNNDNNSITKIENNEVSNENANIIERLNILDEKILRLEKQSQNLQNDNSLNCGIAGVMTSAGFDKMSSSEAIEEVSRNSNLELVVTCTIK